MYFNVFVIIAEPWPMVQVGSGNLNISPVDKSKRPIETSYVYAELQTEHSEIKNKTFI